MNEIKTFDPNSLDKRKFYQLLTGSITPRPIALVSSCDINGNANLSPFSFFNVFSINPPILVFSPVSRVRSNTNRDTLSNVKQLDEVVINLVSRDSVHQVSLASADYDSEVNEFDKSGLTPVDSAIVVPYRVEEAYVSFECKVTSILPLGDKAGAGTLVICEVLLAHARTKIFNEDGSIDPLKLDIVARLGGNNYTITNKEGVYEIEKPISELGMGVDLMPEEVKNSKVLSGNDLGRLGTLTKIPSEAEITEFRLERTEFLNLSETELHNLATVKLEDNKIEEAWEILLYNYYN